MTILVITIFLYTFFLIIFLSLFYSAVRYVPFVPTERKVIKKMIEAANLKDGQKVYDLGCGDGRLLIEAMKKKNIKAHGVEINRFINALAKFRIWRSGKKANIIHKNFFQISLKESDVIFCYLFPKVMQKLKMKFQEELNAGTMVISYCFPINDWVPVRTIQTREDKPKNFLIYVYQTPCQMK